MGSIVYKTHVKSSLIHCMLCVQCKSALYCLMWVEGNIDFFTQNNTPQTDVGTAPTQDSILWIRCYFSLRTRAWSMDVQVSICSWVKNWIICAELVYPLFSPMNNFVYPFPSQFTLDYFLTQNGICDMRQNRE